jgi:hypothetical protein
VQRPLETLGRWLQASTEAVAVATVKKLMARLEKHEPRLHSRAESLLSTGTMPPLMFCASSVSVNPALLCCMHACHTYSSKTHAYLPCPENTDAGVELVAQDIAIGEVWWLLDAEQPYLAEVFMDGDVPNNRLPHVNRCARKGMHVARLLGDARNRTKEVSKKARMCLFTPW